MRARVCPCPRDKIARVPRAVARCQNDGAMEISATFRHTAAGHAATSLDGA